MNVSLPDALRAFVEDEVASGEFGTASAYVQHLIRRERRRVQVRQLLLDGLASGPGVPFDDGFRTEMRARAASEPAR
jgi:antitoxin ParD1/3/4